jgi:hypothetical protein
VAKGKRRRKLATLDGIEIKMVRAQDRANELHDAFRRAFPRGTCKTTVKVHDEGRRHVYRADHPPEPDPRWGAIAGDSIHNMRTALDYLACELVRLCDGEPNTATAFPILSRPPRRRCTRRRLLPDISGGVSDEIRERLRTVQPYERRHALYTLAHLRDLDNIDKHRTIVTVSLASAGHVSSRMMSHPERESGTILTGRPLEHDQVIGIVTYDPPQPQPDPSLEFMAHIAFGVGEPLAKDIVWDAVMRLRERVNETIDLFRPMFPNP